MRHQWTIPFHASQVARLAEARLAYHRVRLDAWEAEHKQAQSELQAKGVEVRSYDVTGGQRQDVTIDPVLAKRLGECQAAIKKHQTAIDELERWHRVLRDRDSITLDLTQDDLEFFGA